MNTFKHHRLPGQPWVQTGPLDPHAVIAPPYPPDPARVRRDAVLAALPGLLDAEGVIDLSTVELARIADGVIAAYESATTN